MTIARPFDWNRSCGTRCGHRPRAEHITDAAGADRARWSNTLGRIEKASKRPKLGPVIAILGTGYGDNERPLRVEAELQTDAPRTWDIRRAGSSLADPAVA